MAFNPRCTVGAGNNGTGDFGTAIQDRQAWVDGFADNVPADHTIRVVIGTTSGGPYGGVWISAGTAGNNTLNQVDITSRPAFPLLPSTQYFLVAQVWDAGNNVVGQSTECTFTTLAGPNYLAKMCGGFVAPPPSPNSPGFARNRLQVHVLTDDLPVFFTQDQLLFETALSPTGPWTPSDLRHGNHTVQANPIVNPTNSFLQFIGVPTHNTDYYIRVTVQNPVANNDNYPNQMDIQHVVCGPFKTFNYPSLKCLQPRNDQRGYTNLRTFIGLNPLADWNSDPAWGPDRFKIHWGTTPGGPYPNSFFAAANQPNFTLPAGTAPPCSKIYYYVEAIEQVDTNGVYATSPECVTSTLCSACQLATNVTETSATINAAITAPAGQQGIGGSGQKARIAWGTTPGGPYPNLGPAVLGDSLNPQNLSLPVTGLTPGTTYYYVLQVSNNSGVFGFDQSPECTFKTPLVVTNPPTAVTNQCATLQGNSPSNNPGCQYVFDFGTTSGGPYTQTIPAGSSTGNPEAFFAQLCSLNPNTQYFYRARLVCDVIKTASTGAEKSFTTLNGIYYCGTLHGPGECIGVDINGDGTIDYYNCLNF